MSAAVEKVEKDHIEVTGDSSSPHASEFERSIALKGNYIPNEARNEDVVTLKTWMVIVVLSCSYGLSFWVVTTISAIQTQVAAELGNASNASWWTTM
ncbi:hypothetical protein SLS60_000961 [Paraconiothyrium brasiliense]|uniref:Major facilitator superfamily (MFS) profile domain-containing protein n=1 Tax=Paraconiothyrium brasiliense TaxID=300254 RepID=A0ABR3S967_9PLEO